MKSLRTKFVSNTVLVFLIILVLMFSIFAALMHAFFSNTVTVLDQIECELVAEDVNMRLGEYRSITESLSQNANLADMLVTCTTPELFNSDHNFPLIAETIARVQKENTSLWVFSLNHEYQIQSDVGTAQHIALTPQDRDLLDTLGQKLTDTIFVEYTAQSNSSLYNVITPVLRNGQLIGLVGTSIDTKALLQSLGEKANINNMNTLCSLLVPSLDENMKVLWYSEISLDSDGTLKTSRLDGDYPEIFKDGAQQVQGTDNSANGEKYLGPVGSTGWYLTTFVTEATISGAFLGNYLTFGMWAFLAFMIVALTLVALLAFRLTRPIHDLDALVADISHGRPYERLKGDNEVTRAADSLIELVNDDRSLLNEINSLAHKIALGEMFTRFHDGKDEHTQHEIKASLNQMLDSITCILDNLPLGVAVLDEDYQLIYINEAIRNLLEIHTGEIQQGLYITHMEQLSEQHRKVIKRGIDDCKAGGKHISGKLFLMHRHLNVATVPLNVSFDSDAKPVFLQVYLNQTDVMEKVQEQEQIFAYFEHLSLVKKEALERLSKGNFNQASMEIGQRPSAPYLQEIYDNQLEMKQAFRDTVNSIEAIITQMQQATMVFASGNLHATIDAQNAKGQYAYLVKTANNAFHVILSYFQSIPVPIRIIDKDYRVVFCNDASSKGGFYPEADDCCYRWFHSDTPCVSCPYQEKTSELTIREITLEQNGKRTYWRVYRNPLLDENGNITSILEILIDETNVVELKKAADSANLAKSTFIANMSHEIRTPMNAVLGYSQLLEMNRSLSQENRSYVETIKKSGNHLLGLINDILELSKIEAGKIQMNKEPFDLFSLLADVQSMFQPQMEAKGLHLVLTQGKVHRFLIGDLGKTRQILINLISNALKFTNQGEIRIHVSGEEKDEGRIRLTLDVTDTGSGIAPEEQNKVFYAFEQTHTGIKSGSGTGLGMAISRNFAMLMDGDLIILNSQIGKGTTFRLTLEMDKGQEPPNLPSDSGKYDNILGLRTPRTVLVADAAEDHRELLKKILENLGFSVLCAEDNRSALELWRSQSPHILITDLSNDGMDGMDGLQLIHLIRREELQRRTPILIITANALQEDKDKALSAGADSYMTKPLVVKNLAMELEKFTEAEYLFGDEQERVSMEGMQKEEHLSRESQEKIHQAVLQGDFDTVLEIAHSIQEDFPFLASRLIQFADDFDKDSICNLLNEVEN